MQNIERFGETFVEKLRFKKFELNFLKSVKTLDGTKQFSGDESPYPRELCKMKELEMLTTLVH